MVSSKLVSLYCAFLGEKTGFFVCGLKPLPHITSDQPESLEITFFPSLYHAHPPLQLSLRFLSTLNPAYPD